MEIKQFTRKPFPVNAVQVTLQNIEEVAEWCKGAIEYVPTKMMGTITDLPVVKMKGMGENRGKEFVASLGCWIVELKGSFRSYKHAQFEASFDEYNEVGPFEGDDGSAAEEGTPELLQEAEEFASKNCVPATSYVIDDRDSAAGEFAQLPVTNTPFEVHTEAS